MLGQEWASPTSNQKAICTSVYLLVVSNPKQVSEFHSSICSGLVLKCGVQWHMVSSCCEM